MVFKKFYCINCESKLVKEKTHRVVTKDDSDYYLYHDRGTFPRNDVVVYEYRFKCEKCNQEHRNIMAIDDDMEIIIKLSVNK